MSRGSGLEAGKASWQEQAQHTLLTQPRAQAPDGKMLNPQGVISFLSMGKTLYGMKYAPRWEGGEGNAPASSLSPQSAFVLLIPGQGPALVRYEVLP